MYYIYLTLACSEKGVRLVQNMQVGPRVPAGIQLEKAEVGPTSGPTWRLSHLPLVGHRRARLALEAVLEHLHGNCTGSARIARLGPTVWLKIPIGALTLAHNLGQPCATFVPAAGIGVCHLSPRFRRRSSLSYGRNTRLGWPGPSQNLGSSRISSSI